MNICVVAAHDFPIDECFGAVMNLVFGLPKARYMIRGTETELVMASASGVEPQIFRGGQREENYRRDVDMVAASAFVIALFHPERVMEGGTGHVVEKALDQGKPVTCYTLGVNGQLILVGST